MAGKLPNDPTTPALPYTPKQTMSTGSILKDMFNKFTNAGSKVVDIPSNMKKAGEAMKGKKK